MGLTHKQRKIVDAKRLAAGYHRGRREASAPLRFPDLYPYGEASYAQRLPFSQRERLAPREKQLARHGGIEFERFFA